MIHDQLPPDAPAELYGGWPMILSGLKTWLETGETLTTPGSLMYSNAVVRSATHWRNDRGADPRMPDTPGSG